MCKLEKKRTVFQEVRGWGQGSPKLCVCRCLAMGFFQVLVSAYDSSSSCPRCQQTTSLSATMHVINFRENDLGMIWNLGTRISADSVALQYVVCICRFHGWIVTLTSQPSRPWALRKAEVILCEYSHALGNSNGSLHSYWQLFWSSTPVTCSQLTTGEGQAS